MQGWDRRAVIEWAAAEVPPESLQTVLPALERELVDGRALLELDSPLAAQQALRIAWGPAVALSAAIGRLAGGPDALDSARNEAACRTHRLVALEKRDSAARARQDAFEQSTSALVEGFLTQAFTIVYAFQVGQFFDHLVAVGWCGGPDQCDKWHRLYIRLIWHLGTCTLIPWLMYLMAFTRIDGIRSRSFIDDVLGLTRKSLPMMIAWSLKDVVSALHQLVDAPINTYHAASQPGQQSQSDLSERMVYLLFNLAVSVGTFVYGLLLRLLAFVVATRLVPAKFHRGYQGIVAVSPIRLAVGYDVTLSWLPWYLGYYPFFHSPGKEGLQFRSSIYQVLQMVVVGVLVRKLTSWQLFREARGRHMEMRLHARNFKENALLLVVGSFQFLLAWLVADFIKFQFYFVMCNCSVPSLLDPSVAAIAGSPCSIWPEVYYGVLVTAGSIAITVWRNWLNFEIRRLDEWWCHELISEMKQVATLRKEHALYVTVLGIIVGWSWTDVALAECQHQLTWTCESASVADVFEYLGMLIFYLLACSMVFYCLNQRWRLMHRIRLVTRLHEGGADRFFEDMDQNHDGRISLGELDGYLDEIGLKEAAKEPFHSAFHLACDHERRTERIQRPCNGHFHCALSENCVKPALRAKLAVVPSQTAEVHEFGEIFLQEMELRRTSQFGGKSENSSGVQEMKGSWSYTESLRESEQEAWGLAIELAISEREDRDLPDGENAARKPDVHTSDVQSMEVTTSDLPPPSMGSSDFSGSII